MAWPAKRCSPTGIPTQDLLHQLGTSAGLAGGYPMQRFPEQLTDIIPLDYRAD